MNTIILVSTLIGTVIASISVLLLVPLLKPLARRVGLVDNPRAAKQHEGDIPLAGGE